MEYIEILENNRPWDCEVFPKSKTICYGGAKLPTPTLNVPQVNLPTANVPDISAMNLTPSQGNLDALSSMGQGIQGALDKNIGLDSALGQNLQANFEGLREGIDHNIKQVGIGGQMLGEGLHHNLAQLRNIGNIGKGGGGGGGGAGVMGPASGGLARLGASKLQQKKAGMGRRQTYLTKS